METPWGLRQYRHHYRARILPTRNGNYCLKNLRLSGLVSTDPTYKEWKLTNISISASCSFNSARILPTRNGNSFWTTFKLPSFCARILPTRNGNLKLLSASFTFFSNARILPTRNGNVPISPPFQEKVRSTDPTYKEWKHLSVSKGFIGINS